MSDAPDAVVTASASETANWLELVRKNTSSLQFGSVLITVHESRVVQVEKSEKVRLDALVRSNRSSPTQTTRR